ncbi:hypothetical protein [Flagellimonas marinaquae]|uniref:hypothetical protein n=1 Tax=Flagellimonas marinaquae TaxID=254955 RepID=UPI0020761637|nr:hypothetical protein [Allomuricauda aquimarina]USD23994.1 hypothetical protein MJO53_09900 [Allomuricauda aquimarina]
MILKNIITIYLFVFTFVASAQTGETKTSLIERATSFINAYSAKQQPNGNVDHFLAFFMDDFKHEYIKYVVIVEDKKEFKKGLVDKLQNKVHFHRVTIEDMIIGNNGIFVKIKIWAKVEPFHMDTIVEHTADQIMSMEFDEKRLIKHLRRHHN